MLQRKLVRFLVLIFTFASFESAAQIGYQVTVFDTATGEPRANETVSASITISDASGSTICSDVQSATTDEFGVLSLEVGNSGTFSNVDWNNLPLYISATVDGVLIGRSQILSVPVAEYAKQTGVLTQKMLCERTWSCKTGNIGGEISLSFRPSGFYTYKETGINENGAPTEKSVDGHYALSTNTVSLEHSGMAVYIPSAGVLQLVGPESLPLK